MLRTSHPAIAVLAFAVCSLPRLGQAFERQWHAGIDAGYASLTREGARSGFGGGAHLAYGLSDAVNLLVEGDVTRHPGASANVWSLGAGAAYTLDVTRAVPYAGILLAAYKTTGPNAITLAPGGQVALGLDYQLERNWAVGVQVRLHTILASPAVTYLTTFLRAEYVWGF